MNIFVAFFVLLLLLSESTPPACVEIPRIGKLWSRPCNQWPRRWNRGASIKSTQLLEPPTRPWFGARALTYPSVPSLPPAFESWTRPPFNHSINRLHLSLYFSGMNIFVAFFLLLILLADVTPPAASELPQIGNDAAMSWCFISDPEPPVHKQRSGWSHVLHAQDVLLDCKHVSRRYLDAIMHLNLHIASVKSYNQIHEFCTKNYHFVSILTTPLGSRYSGYISQWQETKKINNSS